MILLVIILGYLGAALQVGLAPAMSVYAATPDFMLLAAAVIWVTRRRQTVLLASVAIGLWADLLGGGAIGRFAFAYGLASLTGMAFARVIDRPSPARVAAVIFAAGLVSEITLSILDGIRGTGMHLGTHLLSVLYTTLVGAAMIPPAARFIRLSRRNRRR